MSERCEVCRHPDLAAIDAELQQNKSLPLLARSYEIDESTLRRHKREHQRGIALKAHIDPVSLIQDALDLKAGLELRLGLGISGGNEIGPKDYAILSGQYVRVLEFVAKLTGASVPRDPKDLIPLWNRMLKVMMEGVKDWPPEYRDKLYLMLEAAEKEAG